MSDKPDRRNSQRLAALSIQPLLRRSVAAPRSPSVLLVGKGKRSRNSRARMINDFLADPSTH